MCRSQFDFADQYKTVEVLPQIPIWLPSVPPDSAIQSVVSARKRDNSSGGFS
jgi:hypothetical protein